MDDSTKTMMLTLASGVIKKGLITLGATAVTHGIIASNQTETFVAAGMFLVGAGWSFWNDYGKAIVLSKLEVLKAQSLAQAAKLRNAGIAAPTVTEIAAQHPTLTPADVTKAVVVKILIAAFLLSAFLFVPPAMAAQTRLGPIGQKMQDDFERTKATVTDKLTADPKAALPCMDITVLTKLTLANLVPTMKACVQDANNQLVSDTQRALDSAEAFTGSATSDTAVGDNDAINCLKPGLALFKAAAIVPAVPDVLNPDGTMKTKGTPQLDPGPILLFQKYREFTIKGGLTSCQAWVNGPVNATAAAGGAGVAGAVGAAILLPK